MTDLFEHPDLWPDALSSVIDAHYVDEHLTHSQLTALLDDCQAIGYTFDYGLDLTPFNLRKL